jgi:hypothetical protein
LKRRRPGVKLPALYRKAIVQAHCHHAAIIKLSDEEAILKRLGLGYEILDSGCCGMAGSFGYERGKYEVSVRCGERVLLPAVRSASKDTLIIADGFSCREQIEQLTGRRALHLAEVIQMALDKGPNGPAGNYPEKSVLTSVPAVTPRKELAIVVLAAAVAGATVVWRMTTRRRHWRGW